MDIGSDFDVKKKSETKSGPLRKNMSLSVTESDLIFFRIKINQNDQNETLKQSQA